MHIIFQLLPLAYHENEISVMLNQANNQFKLIQIEVTNNFNTTVQNYFKEQFNCDLQTKQIQYLSPTIQTNRIEIPIIIQIHIDQLPQLTNTNQYQNNYSFENINLLINLNQNDQQIIQNGHHQLINDYHLNQLTAIHQLITPEFTTRYLTAFIRKLTHEPIKYNNIRRMFEPQLKFIKLDRSKKGHPKSIFKYQTPKKP